MLRVTIPARLLLASMDCGVCFVRQCGLWCVFCAPDSARLDGLFFVCGRFCQRVQLRNCTVDVD
jgi:hypothetical protein